MCQSPVRSRISYQLAELSLARFRDLCIQEAERTLARLGTLEPPDTVGNSAEVRAARNALDRCERLIRQEKKRLLGEQLEHDPLCQLARLMATLESAGNLSFVVLQLLLRLLRRQGHQAVTVISTRLADFLEQAGPLEPQAKSRLVAELLFELLHSEPIPAQPEFLLDTLLATLLAERLEHGLAE